MIEMTAKTADEAIEIALKELDVERQDVEIDVVSHGKAGILGIGAEPAKVRVTVLEEPSDVVTVATEVLEDIVSLTSADVTVNLRHAFREDVGGPVFDVDGDDAGLLIGRRGETLRSLQFLTTFIASRIMEERVSIFVDVAGYQERRYDSLRSLAQKVARRVSSSGRPITLEPMPPNERRIVHLALADNPDVETGSTGSGEGRRVVVEPAYD
jgi:spoIIIJ-associated protein